MGKHFRRRKRNRHHSKLWEYRNRNRKNGFRAIEHKLNRAYTNGMVHSQILAAR